MKRHLLFLISLVFWLAIACANGETTTSCPDCPEEVVTEIVEVPVTVIAQETVVVEKEITVPITKEVEIEVTRVVTVEVPQTIVVTTVVTETIVDCTLCEQTTEGILDILARFDNFTTLSLLLEMSGLNDLVDGEESITLFAPTDGAFERMAALHEYESAEYLSEFLLDESFILETLVLHHMSIPDQHPLMADETPRELRTLDDNGLTLISKQDKTKVDYAQVVSGETQLSNGTMFAIDQVLLDIALREVDESGSIGDAEVRIPYRQGESLPIGDGLLVPNNELMRSAVQFASDYLSEQDVRINTARTVALDDFGISILTAPVSPDSLGAQADSLEELMELSPIIGLTVVQQLLSSALFMAAVDMSTSVYAKQLVFAEGDSPTDWYIRYIDLGDPEADIIQLPALIDDQIVFEGEIPTAAIYYGSQYCLYTIGKFQWCTWCYPFTADSVPACRK